MYDDKAKKDTRLTIENGNKSCMHQVVIDLAWDAGLDDWRDAFATVLIAVGFLPQQINEILPMDWLFDEEGFDIDEDEDDEDDDDGGVTV